MVSEAPELIPVEEFLSSVGDPLKRGCLDFGMGRVISVLRNIKRLYRSDVVVPEIKVLVDQSLVIQAMGDRVQVSVGFFGALYDGAFPSFPEDADLALPREYVVASMLIWAFSHEYAHVMRAHWEASAEMPKEARTEKALEFDADNVATAALYRECQHEFQDSVPDDVLRVYCLFVVFWTLRLLPDAPIGSETHLAFPERIRSATGKLTILPKDINDTVVDVDGASELSKSRRAMLIGQLNAFDEVYCKIANLNFEVDRATAKWTPGASEFVRHWQEIKHHVSEKSSTQT